MLHDPRLVRVHSGVGASSGVAEGVNGRAGKAAAVGEEAVKKPRFMEKRPSALSTPAGPEGDGRTPQPTRAESVEGLRAELARLSAALTAERGHTNELVSLLDRALPTT